MILVELGKLTLQFSRELKLLWFIRLQPEAVAAPCTALPQGLVFSWEERHRRPGTAGGPCGAAGAAERMEVWWGLCTAEEGGPWCR